VLFTSYGLHKNKYLSRYCSYEWNSQVSRTRTVLVSMWTVTIQIHANSCLLGPVYRYPDSYSYQYESTVRTGHSLLLASYLHHIRRQQSPVCPHCAGDYETAQHLLLHCPSLMQARISTNFINSSDPWCMWSFQQLIGAMTRPQTGNEREKVTVITSQYTMQKHAISRTFM